MLSYRDLMIGFKQLGIDQTKPVILHASLSSFDEVRGGAETLLGAILATYPCVIAPTFTYRSMITPETGPEGNGIDYGSGRDQNKMAEFYTPDMPADRLMGVLAEKIRLHPQAKRSTHPLLSFAGIQIAEAIETQTLEEPLAPIQWLLDHQGYVLLLGVDQTVNTSIHLAEQKAGRKSFVRWGLTPHAIYECSGFPGCSEGFNQAAKYLTEMTSVTQIGNADIQAIPIQEMVEVLLPVLKANPLDLLCEKENCPRCQAIRHQQNDYMVKASNA